MKRFFSLLYSAACSAVLLLSSAVMLWILCIVLFLNRLPTAEWVRKSFLLPNGILLILSAVILYAAFRTGLLRRIAARFRILPSSIILLAVQLFIAVRIYFETGWDAGENVMTDAWALAAGRSTSGTASWYYSMYPNNVFILFIEKSVFRICRMAGLDSLQYALLVPVAVQCIISCITGASVYRIVLHMNRDREEPKTAAVFGWFLFVILVGLSPWLVVVYTDSLSLFLPVLMIFLYLLARDGGKYRYLQWVLIFLLAYWGYRLKATAAIAAIALILSDILQMMAEIAQGGRNALKKTVIDAAVKGILLLAVLAVSAGLYQKMTAGLGFALDPEKEFTYRHYLMMGWNEESTGTFNFDDVDRSMFINDYDYRNDEDMTEAKRRIRQMLPWDIFVFQAKKTLVNFHDGTFSFGVEGNFYMETFETASPVSKWLRNIFWDTGSGYVYLATAEQGAWITVLALCLISSLACLQRKKRDSMLSFLPVFVTITGIFLFVELFEARARYLYIYVPVFVISAASGFSTATEWLDHRRKKEREHA